MVVKFRDVMNKTDWVKMAILIIVAIFCWILVWREYQKPIIPLDLEEELTQTTD